MSQHSMFSPSAAERWMNCPSSVMLSAAAPPSDGTQPPWAKDGTMAHTIAAQNLCGLPVDEPLNGEMRLAVGYYLAHIKLIRAELLGGAELIEQKLVYHADARVYGTLDYARCANGRLSVCDFKYGRGVEVQAQDNPQLLIYAVLAAEHFERAGETIQEVTMTIVQPRLYGVSHAHMTRAELQTWETQVLAPALMNVDVNAGLKLGAWCRWCPAKMVCPALHGAFSRGLLLQNNGSAAVLSDQALAADYTLIPVAEAYLNAVREEMRRRIENGVMPGWHVAKRRLPPRWTCDEATLFEAFGDDAFVRKPKTPAQMRVEFPDNNRLPSLIEDRTTTLLIREDGTIKDSKED